MNYAIPEGHQLRKRYTKEVTDRLEEILLTLEQSHATISDILQLARIDVWEGSPDDLQLISKELESAATKCYTASNFARALEENAT